MAGGTAVVAGSRLMNSATAEEPWRPNILFLFTDQQHAGMLSCAGNPHVKTPAIDSLARNGARFSNAYTQCPVCMASRAAIHTGR